MNGLISAAELFAVLALITPFWGPLTKRQGE